MERKPDHGFRRLADEVRSRPLTQVAPASASPGMTPPAAEAEDDSSGFETF